MNQLMVDTDDGGHRPETPEAGRSKVLPGAKASASATTADRHNTMRKNAMTGRNFGDGLKKQVGKQNVPLVPFWYPVTDS